MKKDLRGSGSKINVGRKKITNGIRVNIKVPAEKVTELKEFAKRLQKSNIMKNILLLLFALFSMSMFAQTSTYNKHTTFGNNWGEWVTRSEGETFITEQNPVGYKRVVEELKKVLTWYDLDIDKTVIDESLIPSYIDNAFDYQNMSNSCLLEMGEVAKVYKNEQVCVIWLAKKGHNTVNIMKTK